MSEETPPGFKGVWFAEDGEIFLSFENGKDTSLHIESHPLESPAAEGWIRRYLRSRDRRAPSKYDVENFRSDLKSMAYEKQERTQTFLRVAEFEGRIYVDLGRPDWACIEISAEGWKQISLAPVAFRRNDHMHPLPMPEAGGSLDWLKEFIPCQSHEGFLMICSWLINAYLPDGPYFHLILTGEKGATKSSTAKLLQKLIHPSSNSLKGLPKDEENLVIEAYHNRLVMIDNENDLGKWLPNALCRLATGTGFSSRTHYTMRGQSAYRVARPAILTAHELPSMQEDFLERSIHVELERPERTATEKQLNLKFDQQAGKILGAIFDCISTSLANRAKLPEESLQLHRMADASYFIACAAEQIGWDSPEDFLTALNTSQAHANRKGLDNEALIPVLRQAMQSRDIWEATPTQMLEELQKLAINPRLLPKAPNTFSRTLNSLKALILVTGLEVEVGIIASGGKARLIRITKHRTLWEDANT